MSSTTRSLSAVIVTGSLVFGLAACAPADADAPVADDPAEGIVKVTGTDYGFDVEGELEVGSILEFHNASDVEFHEMVVMRLADDEERSVEELLALPQDEAMASMSFVGVAGAAPGEDGEVVDGDLQLTQAGRYVLTCFIPQGADPDVVAEAFLGAPEDQTGPPDFGDGTPHAMVGMVREITVSG